MFRRKRTLADFAADIRHAARIFTRAPGFTLTVLAVLALGIGANTAIFTVINTVLLHPLPYPDADRIVNIVRERRGSINIPAFGYLAQNRPGLEDLAGYHVGISMNLGGGDRPELVDLIQASRSYFPLFGATPLLGRTFTPTEDSAGGPRVLVMSYSLWQRRFGGDLAILGRTVTLGGASYTVIGVLSPHFHPYPPAEAWVPLQADPNSTNLAGVLTVSARLPAGTPLAEAQARVAALGKRYGQIQRRLQGDPHLQVTPLQDQITGDIQPALWILWGAVALVLLIACANVANLLLARATGRQREIAIRAAIGAGRGRIVRQLLSESLLLALGGGVLGLLLGSWGVKAMLALTPGDLPRVQEIAALPAFDPWVAGFTALLSIATGIACGLLPAVQLAPGQLASSLSRSGERSGCGRKHHRIRGALAAAEVALAVVLLCGAVLLIRSFAIMRNTSLGFDAGHVLTMGVSLTGPAYSHASDVDRLWRESIGRVQSLPGVESAAFASALPMWGRMDMIFNIPGRRPTPGQQISGDVQWLFVSPRYFDLLRIPLLAGRRFREQEPGHTVIINQALARQFWPNANPVGQAISIGDGLGPGYDEGVAQIVGVVGDIREQMNGGPWATLYQPPSQIPDAAMALVSSIQPGAILVRTRSGVPPLSLSRPVQQALLAGNSSLPVAKVRTMEQAALDSIARQNFNRVLLGLFAAIALLLAAIGIYGVLSYSVEQRTHEIGIRSALGANRRDILALILRQASSMALLGVAIGLGAALGLTGLLRAQLFGVQPSDPLTFVSVPLILLAVALIAAIRPALRASHVDPLVALRHE